jgi:hypothetical protein
MNGCKRPLYIKYSTALRLAKGFPDRDELKLTKYFRFNYRCQDCLPRETDWDLVGSRSIQKFNGVITPSIVRLATSKFPQAVRIVTREA